MPYFLHPSFTRNLTCKHMKQIVKGLIFVIIPLSFSACEENGANGNGLDDPAHYEVFMQNLSFVPETRTVTVGTTVVWINKDDVLHNVTSTEFQSSQNLARGANHSVTFNEVGSYDYECTLHPGMTGTIVVNPE